MKLKELVEEIKRLPPEKRVEALKRLRALLKKREEKTKQQEEAAEEMMDEAEFEQAAINHVMQLAKPKNIEDLFKEEPQETVERPVQAEVHEEVERIARRTTEQNYQRVRQLNEIGTRSYEQERELYEITAAEELKRQRGYEDNDASRRQFEALEEKAGNVRKYAQSLAESMREQERRHYMQSQNKQYN